MATRHEAVTILDIAREAGVSRTTASSALAGGGRVSAQTRAHVQAVAERLGYIGNPIARRLRTGRTGAVGIYLEESLLEFPFYVEFVLGITSEVRHREHAVTLIPGGPGASAALAYVDGVVIGDPVMGDPVVEMLMSSGLPIVCAEACLDAKPSDSTRLVTMETDYVSAELELLNHLYAHGSRTPTLLTMPLEISVLHKLEETYRLWCEDHGLTPRVHRTEDMATPGGVVGFARELLASPDRPDAVLAAADRMALGVYDAARNSEVQVLIASCIDGPALSLMTPGITAIVAPPRDIGRDAVRRLLDLINGLPVPSHVLRPRPEIALRGTTAQHTESWHT